MNKNTALLLIDVQKGFRDPVWGKRNNPQAEKNIQRLLKIFRKALAPVIHVQHLSTEPQSPLRPDHPGVTFMEEAQPLEGEPVFQKNVNSAFIGTELESYLRVNQIGSLVVVGFTTDHCVSTTARMAANLGFQVTILSDATVTFQKTSPSGKIFDADLVHEVSLASLSGEFAVVKSTSQILETDGHVSN